VNATRGRSAGLAPPVVRPRRISPPALYPGDTIGLVSPSSPDAARFPRRFARAIAELQRLGYQVKIAHGTRRDGRYTAGTVAQRLDDLHEMFSDPQVKAVMTSIGGHNANHLLEGLDYDLIAARPKLLIGYSDATALLLAIWRRTGLGVVMGPQLLPQVGEFGGCLEYSARSILHVLGPESRIGPIEPSAEWTDEMLYWDQDDTRLRSLNFNAGPYTLRAGRATGSLVGANLPTLLRLAGTSFWPNLDRAVLLLETNGPKDIAEFDAQLTQLRHLGVLEQVSGIGLGRFPSATRLDRSPLLVDVVDEVMGGFNGPIVAGLDVGHTDPMFVVPFGILATLTAGSRVLLTYDEPAVLVSS
jgi:muramoyltetrapeptide carboxypeptidase